MAPPRRGRIAVGRPDSRRPLPCSPRWARPKLACTARIVVQPPWLWPIRPMAPRRTNGWRIQPVHCPGDVGDAHLAGHHPSAAADVLLATRPEGIGRKRHVAPARQQPAPHGRVVGHAAAGMSQHDRRERTGAGRPVQPSRELGPAATAPTATDGKRTVSACATPAARTSSRIARTRRMPHTRAHSVWLESAETECAVMQHHPRAHFRTDGTARGSICSEIALGQTGGAPNDQDDRPADAQGRLGRTNSS